MKPRAEIMRQLRDQLEALVKLCDLKVNTVEITPPPKIWQVVERFIQDESLCSYLEGLSRQAEKILKVVKQYKVEAWNGQQNEKELDRLEESYKQLGEKTAKLEDEKKRLADEVTEAGKRITELLDEQKKTVLNVIAMYDNLLTQESWMMDTAPENGDAAKILQAQKKEMERLLETMGVTVSDEKGVFDKQKQMVVEIKETSEEKLIDTVAETFRPGYSFHGEMIRPQEVILYVKESTICP